MKKPIIALLVIAAVAAAAFWGWKKFKPATTGN